MANWAWTSYAIEGPQETLQKIEQAILHHDIQEGSEDSWEGNVLNALGVEWINRNDDRENGLYMRGFIREDTEPWYLNGALRFDAEEAWGVTDFNKALEKAFPEIKVYWTTEESDGGVYATNDKEGKYFNDRFYVDACIDGNYHFNYFTFKSDALKWLYEITNGRVNTEEKIAEFNSDYEDSEAADENFIYLYEFEIIG